MGMPVAIDRQDFEECMSFLMRVGGLAGGIVALCLSLAAPAQASEDPATQTAAASVTQLATPTSHLPLKLDGMEQDERLHALVISWVDYGKHDAELECLAGAIYFEARGEPLDGQLAVAQVVLNRAGSGIYPSSICDVVTQPAQFSFIRNGEFPPIDHDCELWHQALAVADIARKQLVQEIAGDVLWYHADYVSPAWGQRLTRAAQIGRHIFYQKG